VTQVDYPFRVDALGVTALTNAAEHVRDMIEQLLFTSPGERVNRPDFGSGLMQLVFEPTSAELAAALRLTIQAALDRWLGDVVAVTRLEVTSVDTTVRVVVEYRLRSGETRTETFEAAQP
jgi:uncharacterized protein